MKRLTRKLARLTPIEKALLAVLLPAGVALFAVVPVTYKDWVDVFRPAALHWLTPYFQPGLVFNPPWLFPLLYPIALLPERIGAGLIMLLSFIVLGVYVGSPKKMAAVALAAPMTMLFTLGQLDAILLIALLLPAEWALPLLVIKPQGVFLAMLPRLTRRSAAVLAGVLAVSVLVWGFWWQHIIGFAPNQTVNVSLFPYSLIAGLPLLYFGLRRRSDAMLCAASLCVAPYFMLTSMLPAIAAFVKEVDDWRWWVAIIVVSWIYLLAARGVF